MLLGVLVVITASCLDFWGGSRSRDDLASEKLRDVFFEFTHVRVIDKHYLSFLVNEN